MLHSAFDSLFLYYNYCFFPKQGTGKFYALKVINLKLAEKSMVSVEDLDHDVAQLLTLRHSNIATYVRSYRSTDSNSISVMMEFIEGPSMAELISSGAFASAPVDRVVLSKWLQQTTAALNHLHSNCKLLHGDIKPENIKLIGTEEGGADVKLVGLGLTSATLNGESKSKSGSDFRPGSGTGSRNTGATLRKVVCQVYSSFEKTNGLPFDGRDDMWAVGCVFAELLLGRPPACVYQAAVKCCKPGSGCSKSGISRGRAHVDPRLLYCALPRAVSYDGSCTGPAAAAPAEESSDGAAAAPPGRRPRAAPISTSGRRRSSPTATSSCCASLAGPCCREHVCVGICCCAYSDYAACRLLHASS